MYIFFAREKFIYLLYKINFRTRPRDGNKSFARNLSACRQVEQENKSNARPHTLYYSTSRSFDFRGINGLYILEQGGRSPPHVFRIRLKKINKFFLKSDDKLFINLRHLYIPPNRRRAFLHRLPQRSRRHISRIRNFESVYATRNVFARDVRDKI